MGNLGKAKKSLTTTKMEGFLLPLSHLVHRCFQQLSECESQSQQGTHTTAKGKTGYFDLTLGTWTKCSWFVQ